ncbi:SPFH domain-containing protein [Streptacidiphilus rugosus]|uniref:SPFH domain-containing protein n=1 Tax=Streptacidiphilus rugosus TaxID=405783 RepID=UPI0012FA9C2D|nr:SPFH domain-containing protein [Streptacidiphilus rugosus]
MDQPAERQATAPWAVRRPPRSDAELRERPARGVLPGWTAFPVVAAAVVGAVLVQARRAAGLPSWAPGGRALHDSGPVLADRPAVLLLALCGLVTALALFGLMANPVGTVRVLSRWGGYRGSVRRSGLVWVNPLLKRRAVDVRIRHWRSEPIAATDREGSPITAELMLVWQVKDTARARFAVDDHGAHLAASAEAVFCRIASTLPCDSFVTPGPSLRDGQWLGGELTRLLGAEMAPVGVAVYSVQAVGLGYRADFADGMRRRRLAELDAGTREVIVGDAVETATLTLRQLERDQGLTLDADFRASLTRDLVTAFLAVPVAQQGSDAAVEPVDTDPVTSPVTPSIPAPGSATAVPGVLDPLDALDAADATRAAEAVRPPAPLHRSATALSFRARTPQQ